VHGTVRDPTQLDRLQHLTDVAKNAPGTLKFFKGDLMTPGSFEEGMKGCSIVFHMASPVVLSPKDPQKDLIEPAVKGTESVLHQASKTPSVKRVVLTSSTVAICNDASDSFKAPDQKLTESDWNTGSTLDYNPYNLSKVKAEQAAWTIAGSQTQWSLVVINPGLVMGPGLKYHASSDTVAIFVGLVGGDMANGCPAASLPIVDVRDVAHAHVMAAYTPKAHGRNIINGSNTTLVEMADCLREKYSNYPLPSRTVPKFLLWLLLPTSLRNPP
jgi:dihydroflavonol-4-reductase